MVKTVSYQTLDSASGSAPSELDGHSAWSRSVIAYRSPNSTTCSAGKGGFLQVARHALTYGFACAKRFQAKSPKPKGQGGRRVKQQTSDSQDEKILTLDSLILPSRRLER